MRIGSNGAVSAGRIGDAGTKLPTQQIVQQQEQAKSYHMQVAAMVHNLSASMPIPRLTPCPSEDERDGIWLDLDGPPSPITPTRMQEDGQNEDNLGDKRGGC